MSLQHVLVEAIRSHTGNVYIGIDAEENGRVQINGQSHRCPTFLMYRTINWTIVSFDDDAEARKHLPSMAQSYDAVFRLSPYGPLPCDHEGSLQDDAS